MDMLHGAIGGKLLRFSLPIAFTGVAEQLFNSADVLILGQFVGKDAMAAVGNDIPAISLMVLLLLGLSMGVNVVMAQHIGGRHEKTGGGSGPHGDFSGDFHGAAAHAGRGSADDGDTGYS